MKCDICHQERQSLASIFSKGVYYSKVCRSCMADLKDEVSSNAIGFDRRRQYEDNAQDTVQPYDAAGPNLEFLRLYPQAAAKVFSPAQIEEMKRKL